MLIADSSSLFVFDLLAWHDVSLTQYLHVSIDPARSNSTRPKYTHSLEEHPLDGSK